MLETEGDELPALNEDGELILPPEPTPTVDANRIFLASWGSNFANTGIRQVAGDFFSNDDFYNADDIQNIADLEVGDVWTWRHSNHIVIRLSDNVVISTKGEVSEYFKTKWRV